MNGSSHSKRTAKWPRPYLSWSALETWERGANNDHYEFYKVYVLGQVRQSPAMTLGKNFSDTLAIGAEHEDPVVEQCRLLRGADPMKCQKKIQAEYAGVPLLGILDEFEVADYPPPAIATINEDKTGRTTWDQERADKHGQLGFYGLLVALSLGIPLKEVAERIKMNLFWFPTEYGDRGLELQGDFVKFETKRTERDLLFIAARAVRAWAEIGDWYWKKCAEVGL